ncbi:MAG: ribosome assembly cofactor RimP [Bacteroidia bacterium]
MISEKKIRSLISEKINGTACFIVDVSVSTSNKITVLIDSDEALTVKDCVGVSRQIEGNLDREKEDFELTVSSPGIDSPLKVMRQYTKSIGKQVQSVTKEGITVSGKLIFADEAGIEIEETKTIRLENKKGKKTIVENIKIPFETLKETKRMISFNK